MEHIGLQTPPDFRTQWRHHTLKEHKTTGIMLFSCKNLQICINTKRKRWVIPREWSSGSPWVEKDANTVNDEIPPVQMVVTVDLWETAQPTGSNIVFLNSEQIDCMCRVFQNCMELRFWFDGSQPYSKISDEDILSLQCDDLLANFIRLSWNWQPQYFQPRSQFS